MAAFDGGSRATTAGAIAAGACSLSLPEVSATAGGVTVKILLRRRYPIGRQRLGTGAEGKAASAAERGSSGFMGTATTLVSAATGSPKKLGTSP